MNEIPRLCFACLKHPAHPEAFGLCESCDDLPGSYPLATRPEDEAVTQPDAGDAWTVKPE